MELRVKDLTHLFQTPANTIYGWIRHKNLPSCRIGDQYYFNQTEVLDWAISHEIRFKHWLFPAESSTTLLSTAFEAGGLFNLPGDTSTPLNLQAQLEQLPWRGFQENQFVFHNVISEQVYLIGNLAHYLIDDVVVPSACSPIVIDTLTSPQLLLFNFKRLLIMDSFKKKPIHSWFWILSPTVYCHRMLLERLFLALDNPLFSKAICAPETSAQVLQAIQTWEYGDANKQ